MLVPFRAIPVLRAGSPGPQRGTSRDAHPKRQAIWMLRPPSLWNRDRHFQNSHLGVGRIPSRILVSQSTSKPDVP